MIPSWGPTLSRLIPDVWFENVNFFKIEDEHVLIGDNSNEFPETIWTVFFGDKRAPNIGDPICSPWSGRILDLVIFFIT